MREFLSIFYWFFFSIFLFWKNFFLFYTKNITFARIDLTLLLLSFWKNPYRICRKYWEKRGLKHQIYGETPFEALKKITETLSIDAQDVIYDLGSGRGRVSFWFACFTPAKKIIGIESVPIFKEWAEETAAFWNIDKVSFFEGDFLSYEYPNATLLFLAGPHYSDEELLLLTENSRFCKPGTRLILIGRKLPDSALEKGIFSLTQELSLDMDWGPSKAFFYVHSKPIR